jgi:hypothetical protein
MTDVSQHFLEKVRRQLRGHKRLGEGAIAQLQDAERFVAPDPESNSMAILVNHLAGNMRSRFIDFLTTDGEKLDRHRDREFEVAANSWRDDIMRGREQGWAYVFVALDSLKPEDLTRTVYIRQEPQPVRAGAEPRPGTLRISCRPECFPGETPALAGMEDAERAPREVRGIQPEVRGRTPPKCECPQERAHPQGLASARRVLKFDVLALHPVLQR